MHAGCGKAALALIFSLPIYCGDVNDALISAAQRGDLPKVQVLLTQGAIVDAHGDDYVTPLILSAQNDHTEVVRFLLARGAGVNFASRRGVEPH